MISALVIFVGLMVLAFWDANRPSGPGPNCPAPAGC
jgi:hypothetical protein